MRLHSADWHACLIPVLLTTVLALVVSVLSVSADAADAGPATATISTPPLPPDTSITVAHGDQLRSDWALSPFAAMWRLDRMAGTRTLVTDAANRLVPNDGLWRLVNDLHDIRLDGRTTSEGNGAWRLHLTLPMSIDVALAAITGSWNRPSTPTLTSGAWNWRWDSSHLEGRYGDAPGAAAVAAAGPTPAPDLELSADVASLFRHGDDVPSAEMFTAVGFTSIRYAGTLDQSGLTDHIDLPGFQAPLGTITRADLAGIPAKPWAVMALNIDGARLAALLTRLRQIPEFTAACDHYGASPAAVLGSIEDLARALHGTMVACAVPAVPFPNLAVSLPGTPAMDSLVDGLATLFHIPAAGARTSATLIPMPGPWPAMLWLRRDMRWALSTDESLANQLATGTPVEDPPKPVNDSIGASGMVYVQVAPVASSISQFVTLALPTTPAANKTNLVIARDISLACASSTLRMDAIIRTTASDTSISGHTAILASLIPFTAILVPCALEVKELESQLIANARQRLVPMQEHAVTAGWPATMPDEVRTLPHQTPRLAGQPWALYLQPAADAPNDQPVVVSDPRYLGGHCLWMTRDGQIRDGQLSTVRPLWTTAQALSARGGTCTAADWAEAKHRVHDKRYADVPIITNAEANYTLVVPQTNWHEMDAKASGKDWDRLWQDPKADMLFGIIAERVTEEHTKNWLHDVVMEQKRRLDPQIKVLSDTQFTISGLPAQRIRLEGTVNKVPLYFDMALIDHHGYLFQLIVWCGSKTTSSQALGTATEALFDRFSVIDAERYTPGFIQASKPLALMHSPRMDFHMDLTGLGWLRTPKPKDANAYVETRARNAESKANMYMVTADYGSRTLNDRALMHGLLGIFGVPPASITEERTVTTGMGETIALRYPLGDGDNQFSCRAWLGHAHNHAIMIVVNGLTSDHVPDAVGDALIARVSVTPMVNTPIPVVATDAATDGVFAGAVGAYLTNNKRHLEALPWLLAAASQPHPSTASLQAVLTCFCQVEQWQEAMNYYQKQVEPTVDDLGISSFKPWFLLKLNRDAEAIASYRTLFAAGWTDDSDFAAYIDLLHKKPGDAVEAAFTANPVPAQSPAGRRLHARILTEDGKPERAESDLRAALTAAPDDLTLADALADNLLDQKKPAAAREFLSGFLSRHARAATLWHLAGVADYRTDRFHEATTDFKTELEINPGAQAARDYLDAINRRLGKGDTSRISATITPVAGITEIAPSTMPAPPGGAFALRATAMTWDVSSGFLRSDRLVIAVTDRAACETFNTLRFGFDPGDEDFSVNHVTVRDHSGILLSEGHIEDWYVLDDSKDAIVSTKKTVSIPISGLRPGCTIDCLTTRRQLGATTTIPFTAIDMGGHYATLMSTLSLRAPAARVTAITGGALHLQRDGDLLHIEAANLPGRHWEPLTPDTRTDLPVVWIGPVGETWAALGRSYLTDLATFLVDQPTVVAQAQATIAGVTSREGRIAALADLVQSRTSYNAVEFGRRGRIPQPAATTLERRLGDCKDHAVLLQRLLAAAGIPAFLALAPRDEMIIDSMPDMDQFDHMVVVVPGQGSGPAADATLQVLDTTAKEMDLSLSPGILAGRQLLLLDPAAPRLVIAPNLGASRIGIDRTWTVDASGSVRCDEVLTITGYWASSWRGRLIGKQPDDRRREIQEELGHPVSTLTTMEVTDLEDTRRPLTITLGYTMRDTLAHSDGRITGTLPEPWFGSLWEWSVQRGEDRHRALSLRYPLTVAVTSHIHIPTGMTRTPIPIDPDDDDAFLAIHQTSSPDGATSLTLTQHIGEFPAARYGAWCDRIDTLSHRISQSISLTPRSGAAAH